MRSKKTQASHKQHFGDPLGIFRILSGQLRNRSFRMCYYLALENVTRSSVLLVGNGRMGWAHERHGPVEKDELHPMRYHLSTTIIILLKYSLNLLAYY